MILDSYQRLKDPYNSTAIEANTITLDSIVTLTITNIYQLKTMLYLHVLQSDQL